MILPDDESQGVIRITRDQANSPHVDGLLKRQMSMRGEAGITRDRRRYWFYQNWFIFSVAGALAAIAAWAILDPYFQDYIYWQGTVTAQGVTVSPATSASPQDTDQDDEHAVPAGLPTVQINGQTIAISPRIRVIAANGATPAPSGSVHLRVGDRVGVYLDTRHEKRGSVPLAAWMVPQPDPAHDTDSKTTLDMLESHQTAAGLLLFPVVAALVGMAIGASDGIVCHVIRRAVLAGAIGLVCGFIGGFISALVGGFIYMPLHHMAEAGVAQGGWTTKSLVVQVMGRGVAWAAAGVAMGLGQGIALRSSRLLLYGILGGVIGGLLGGLLFDPIDMLLLGRHAPTAHWSRMIGFAVIGISTGAMIGVVELLARDAWLRMTEGPLAGKEFLIFKDAMRMGSSPHSEIYLFNNPQVSPDHAVLRTVGDNYEVENSDRAHPIRVNGRPVTTARLRHGDQIAIGRTLFVFNCQRTA